MNILNGSKSILLFVLAIVVLVLLSVFDAALSGLSMGIQRAMLFVFQVVPGMAGILFGFLGITRREPRRWVAVIGLALNTLSTLFFGFLLLFVG